MAIQFIDTHCHLYLPELKEDLPAIIKRAENEGIIRFYLPAIDSSEDGPLLKTEEDYPGKCFAMMGLHPCSVKENYQEELKTAQDWLGKRRFFGIGEIGLDYYWDRTFTKEQEIAFHEQIEWAQHYDLPVIIHSRESIDDCIGIVQEHQQGNLKGIFHCFTGSYEQAKKIIDTGFHLGIGGVLTYKNSGLATVIEKLPLESLVLETDAPYLAPVPFRGKRNESSYLKYVAEKLAGVKGVSIEEIARVTTENAMRVFG